jgi:hydroxyacylglutathione hydrolase
MEFEVVPIITLGGNAYIIKGRHIALVDTLNSKAYGKIEKALMREGLSVGDVEFVLITHNHFDHAGNAARIQRLSGAILIAGAEDAGIIEGTEMLPPVGEHGRLGKAAGKLPKSWVDAYQKFDKVAIDRTVEGGDRIEELGLDVVGLPGHTAGGVGYFDEPGKRAFIGDMVSYFFSRPGNPALVGSVSPEQIAESQELLAGMGLQTAYPGHGKIIEPDASKIIGVWLGQK